MSWGEAVRLTRQLTADPSSAVCAALQEWDYPLSREALALMDLYDAFTNANFKNPKPYPRPWPDPNRTVYGKGTALPLDELARVLAAHRAAVDSERIWRDRNGRLHDSRGRFVATPDQPDPKVV